MQGTSERAGLTNLVRHEAASLRLQDSSLTSRLNYATDVFACGGGQQTSDAQLSKGPAKSELVPAWAPLARLLSNKVQTPFSGNGEWLN